LKTRISLPRILGLSITILLVMTARSVSAGDGVTNFWGVFVGISDYETGSDLDFSVNSASAIYELLLQDSNWDDSRMTLLCDSQASRSAIENAIMAMASNSDDDDICLFFYCGHGGRANQDFSPSDETDGSDEYIACWDSNSHDYTGDFIDDDLGNTLGQIGGTTVVMLDTCFSGGHINAASEKAGLLKAQRFRNIEYIEKPFEQYAGPAEKGDGFAADLVDRGKRLKDASDQSDIIILTSSDDDGTSYQNSEFCLGEFTYFLLLGLKSNDISGDNRVSAEEAFAYLEPALTEYKNGTVTPQLYDSTSGDTNLVSPIADWIVFIGYGDFHWSYPFNTAYKKRRAEYIYTQTQLGQEGLIKGLKIFVRESLPTMSLYNCTIRMKHTILSEYGIVPRWTSSGWETVYSGTKVIDDVGPIPFAFSTPFHYDGVRNIVIDFSFSNPTLENMGRFLGSYSDRYAMIYHARNNDDYGEPTTWADTSPPPTRDEKSLGLAGSYLDIELEFSTFSEVTVDIVGSGSVTLNPPGRAYEAGTEVTLTASTVYPDCWEFGGWSGDLTGSGNPVTITVDSDMNIVAMFQPVEKPGQADSDGDGLSDDCEWAIISGTISLADGTPLCAMALANGQSMFTCGDDLGLYYLDVPLDENNEITLFGFCSGMEPFKVILTPEEAWSYDISMARDDQSREIEVTVQTEPGTTNPDWFRISGTVSYDGIPLCAMVLANGQHIFSCGANLGTFDLEVPLDGNGKITLFCFCFGFAPYKDVFMPSDKIYVPQS
jgi:hypothetical protein